MWRSLVVSICIFGFSEAFAAEAAKTPSPDWKLDLSMVAPASQPRLIKQLSESGYRAEAQGACSGKYRVPEAMPQILRTLWKKLQQVDDSMTCSRSNIKNAYLARLVRCLPRSLPSWNRHEGYYSEFGLCSVSSDDAAPDDGKSSKAERAAQGFALLVHNMDRSPENLLQLWTAYRGLAFELVTPNLYETTDLKKTVDALRATDMELDQLHDRQGMLAAAYEKIMDLHEGPTPENIYAGWPWREQLPDLPAFREGDVDGPWQASFWMRRQVEGNTMVVRQILAEISRHYDEAPQATP